MRNLLSQPINSSHGMTRDKHGEGRSIDNTKTLDTIDSSLGIKDGHLVLLLAHLASAGGMPNSHESITKNSKNLLIRLVLLTGVDFLENSILQGARLGDFAETTEQSDGDFLITLVTEEVGVDERRIGSRVGLESDVASRKGSDESTVDAGVLLAVDVKRDEFDLGPVFRESLKILESRVGEFGSVLLRNLFPSKKLDLVGCQWASLLLDVGIESTLEDSGIVDSHAKSVLETLNLERRSKKDVIPQVLSNTRKVRNNRNVESLQVLLGANTRYHQDLRRLESSAANDDLLAGLEDVVHTDGRDLNTSRLLLVVKKHLLGQTLCVDLESLELLIPSSLDKVVRCTSSNGLGSDGGGCV
ncbi:hypothetical protein HG531_012337 [Fusarium graminearum]|nr:hypothetical protein HG531_012337 [Fusarium graminearum]